MPSRSACLRLLLVCAILAPISSNWSASPTEFVKAHNSRRCLHGAPDLEWDWKIARSAQAHANRCKFEHTVNPRYGENIWAGWWYPSAEDGLAGWYDREINKYDWDNPRYTTATGHFSQVVWKGTRKVGCGIKRGCRGRYDYILTCQYYFFGNVGGGYMSNVLPVSKTSQQCRAECGAPQRTGWDFSGCATHFPGVCNVKCAWGYWGSPMAFCQSTGQWSFQDKCTPMDCGAPARAHVDFSSCADAQHFAETCTPACERGYTGTPTAVCNGVAEWVYGGECRPVDCGPVARASVKAVDCADTAFGGQCAVACADGYTGSATAVCGADGAWVYTEDCVPVDCGRPSRDNVTFHSCTDTTYVGRCDAACATGYTGAPTAECSSSGQWAYGGACAPVDCGPPGLVGAVDFSGCTDTLYGGQCTTICPPGYKGSDGAWLHTHSCVEALLPTTFADVSFCHDDQTRGALVVSGAASTGSSIACACAVACTLGNPIDGTTAAVAVAQYTVAGPRNLLLGIALRVSAAFVVAPGAAVVELDRNSRIALGPGGALQHRAPATIRGDGAFTSEKGSRVALDGGGMSPQHLAIAGAVWSCTGAAVTVEELSVSDAAAVTAASATLITAGRLRVSSATVTLADRDSALVVTGGAGAAGESLVGAIGPEALLQGPGALRVRSGRVAVTSATVLTPLVLSAAAIQRAPALTPSRRDGAALGPVLTACAARLSSGGLTVAAGAGLRADLLCDYGTQTWDVGGGRREYRVSATTGPAGDVAVHSGAALTLANVTAAARAFVINGTLGLRGRLEVAVAGDIPGTAVLMRWLGPGGCGDAAARGTVTGCDACTLHLSESEPPGVCYLVLDGRPRGTGLGPGPGDGSDGHLLYLLLLLLLVPAAGVPAAVVWRRVRAGKVEDFETLRPGVSPPGSAAGTPQPRTPPPAVLQPPPPKRQSLAFDAEAMHAALSPRAAPGANA